MAEANIPREMRIGTFQVGGKKLLNQIKVSAKHKEERKKMNKNDCSLGLGTHAPPQNFPDLRENNNFPTVRGNLLKCSLGTNVWNGTEETLTF